MRASATAAQIALIIVSALPGRWSMSHTTGTVPMRMARPASWRSRNCFRVAARVLRGEALREHHVDASDVEAAAGKEEGEADVEQCERAGGDTRAAEHLQRHASDEQVAVRKEAAAQVTAEEVQAVVECAEHAHQRGGLFHAEMQILRRVEDQGRVEDGAAVPCGTWEKRRDLTKLMPIIFARYLASLTVHVASSQAAPLTHSLPFIRLFSFPIYLAQLPLARFIMRSFVA